MREAKIIHCAQVCVDLTLSIDHLPERGGDVFATKNGISAGGGYNVLYAARQMGAPAVYMGAIGTGAMADVARRALGGIGVEVAGVTLPDVDTGYSVALTEPDGERTFISTRGAETMVPEDFYETIELVEGDVVYLCGYSLVHRGNTEAIKRFARKNAGWRAGHVVFDVSPVVDLIAQDSLDAIRPLNPIWSVNEREAEILCRRYAIADAADGSGGSDEAVRCRALAAYLGNPVIVRVGAEGAWYCDGGEVRHVPALRVTAVDTNGAGDAHAGVLCAALLQGMPMGRGLQLANCAAGLSTTVSGPATCPERDVVESAAESMPALDF
ncbi:carbohydrate kinase [Bifidobacterium lemurum]|uniref:Carbohydrate kinase n=1 Tax=Bifidobacterium lemurum TaxID=1603886 RepID=A0A261FQT2_9BIFI|nr:PfkB family carbohydrate kinase [Bifidobacterium lemurum]OZG61448.1 carbohydrate kinase [Bifidobacterium lemurum]QOL35125.1 carbohydrate kinase [Bifidobacterium lemurum]